MKNIIECVKISIAFGIWMTGMIVVSYHAINWITEKITGLLCD